MDGCDRCTVSNLKIIGARGNSDGVDVCGSRDVTVTGCFIRSYDDSLVLKAFDGDTINVVFEKCVLWNDMARPIEVGVELRCDRVENIYFRDIDVIHSLTCYPIFGIHHGDRAKISNIHFEDIRIENAPGVQLFDFRITDSVWNRDNKKGSIQGVFIDNISFCGAEGQDIRSIHSRIDGFSEENNISNVHIGKITAFGEKIIGKRAIGLEVIGAVSDVFFEENGNSCVIESDITVSKPFELENDGKYHGEVKLGIVNSSECNVAGLSGINVYPKNKAQCDAAAFTYSLDAGERIERVYPIVAEPGKLVFESFGNRIEFLPAVKYIELDYILCEDVKQAPVAEFNNYYGDSDGSIRFACNDKWLEIESDSLKDFDIELFTANVAKTEENQIMFAVEESFFGEAPSVKFQNGEYVPAPEIGNHHEITYVFLNQPKVGKIFRNIASKNSEGRLKIPFECLGTDNSSNEFLLEARLIKNNGYNMPYTRFWSTLPGDTAHMFCRFVRKV